MSHAPLRSKAQSPDLAQGVRAARKPASQLADETAPPVPKFGGSLAGLPAPPPAGGRGGLEPVLRGNMERSFGADFSAVRLHSDAAAARTAGQYAAKAVTVGDNVYFGGGRYAPQSGEGRRLIAHELAHVVQQRRGGATAPRIDGSGGLEREAGRAADQAIGGGRAMVRLGSATGPAAEPEEEPWYKRAISKAKDVGSSVKDKATSFVQEVAKDPKVLIDHAEKLQPAVLLADATQKLADKAKGKPVLEGLTRNIASLAKANSNLVTKPAKAFGEKLVSKDKDGWHVHPLDATKAWKASADAGFKGVHAATFKAIDEFEDLEPAKPTVDEKAHPTLAALEQGSLAVSNATSKYSSQFVGGMGKALFSMVEGVGKMAIHPFDTVKGLGQLPGSSLTNPLKFIGTYAQLEEDLYDATFPDLEEEARQQAAHAEEARKQASEGQPPGKPPERMSYGAALRKFGGAMLPDQERDRKQTVGLVKALGENYIEAWEAKRYAELPGMALVDIGSFFIGGGAASAAGKGGKVAEAASATSKIGELAKTGEVAGSLGKAEALANAGGKLADVAKGTEAAKTAEVAKATEVVDVGKGGAVGEVTEAVKAGDGAKAGEVADATKAAEAHPAAVEAPKPAAATPKPAAEAPKPAAEAPKPVEPAPEGIKTEPPGKTKVDPLEHAEPMPEGLKGEPVNDVKVDPLEHAEPLPEGLKGEAANNARPKKDTKVSSLDEARQKKIEREAAQEAMPLEQKGTGTYGPGDGHVGQPVEVPNNALKGERPPEISAALDRPKRAPTTKLAPARRGGTTRGTGKSTPSRGGGGRPRPRQLPERITPELPVRPKSAIGPKNSPAKPAAPTRGGGKAKSTLDKPATGPKPETHGSVQEVPLREETPLREPVRDEAPLSNELYDDAPLAGPESSLTKEQLAGKHMLEDIVERQRNARDVAKVEANQAAKTRETGKAGAGMQAKPKHHVFPQEHKAWFERRGFKGDFHIDHFTVSMDEWAHQAVHAGGDYKYARRFVEAREFEWNSKVMKTLRSAERAKGSRLTRNQIFDIVLPLMREYQIPPWFVPYR
ncbi:MULTISPECIES: DUF4157 domain-containing protein [unclassified Mesorhizobium]|uniref:eCIS core domain-containing protein n=1 Tax=unclassified Mesorhizobium TaxID=325217 RepID=UPI001092BD48|nr:MULTISPECIES: DUF4157 domain-containing protein [unclassified Mesorhizobium]TGP85603.1 DUF4157 domain-containing protein [Mesorhizobium sp. M8A.F.Ca.ET.218.01.1.1]TGT14754.1 DUF4157 domain-containing protein [Mesorhizobium sp. M8A.F.Ca.ET.213.01.1.1]